MPRLESIIKLILLVGLSAGLIACGSGGDSNDDGGGGNSDAGILFQGDPAEQTIDAIVDYDSGDRTTDSEISVDADGVEIDRTNVEVALVDTATVGEVNTLLESVDGRIVSMIVGVNIIIVKIPDPGDLAGLDAVIATLEASPVVDWVMRADMTAIDSLPGNYNLATNNLAAIDHHIAVLAPAAWNARTALAYPAFGAPLILQADVFGSSEPDTDFDINVLDPSDFFNLAVKPNSHGYHVLGIMAGHHTANPLIAANRDLVTGMYPEAIDLRVVDRLKFNRPKSENEIIKIARDSGRRVVLNTSLHSGCPRPPQQACVLPKAYSWLRKLRGDIAYYAGQRGVLETNFLLHMTSAGNFKTKDGNGKILNPPDDKGAARNSQYSAAVLVTGLINSKGVAVPNVTNTMVVENRVNTGAPFRPGCLSASSKKSADISGIGSLVWSFTDWTKKAGDKSGTSMSTPQVAALGAYIWALKPTLKPAEVISIIRGTASIFGGDAACTDVPSPVIDAYAAVLAVDDAKAIDPVFSNPMDAPARLAILDIVGDVGIAGTNRVFDEYDLMGFVSAFSSAGGVERDFSRFDLNGDGYTGGTTKTLFFNLDIDAAQVHEEVMQDIEGNMVTYDENQATDWEILCYYAYSTFYNGTEAGRSAALGASLAKCGVLGDSILFMREYGEDKEIYSMNSNGTGQDNLTDNMLIEDDIFIPAFSPDRARIVFQSTDRSGNEEDGNAEIYVMNADGTMPINLSKDGSRSDRFPAWSPDGLQVVFISRRNGNFDIYEVDADGSTPPEQRTDDTLRKSFPSYSPDGAKIVFQGRTDAGVSNIYLMDAGGGDAQNLSGNNTADDLQPIWSPDGNWILFTRRSDPADITTWEIYVVASDGLTLPVNLTDNNLWDDAPSWSPDGSKIAFLSDAVSNPQGGEPGNPEIYVMDFNSNNSPKRLTNYSLPDLYPHWTSDGKKIYFERWVNYDEIIFTDIFIIDAEGNSPPVNLTKNEGYDILSDP